MNNEPHNYDNLTPEQIGEGHALLAVGQITRPGYQFWLVDNWVNGRDIGRMVDARDQVTRRAKI